VKFIFATTEYHKIPDTILSRCQQYDFRMIPAKELLAHLRQVADGEKIQVTDESLAKIARAAEGSARDALSLFDQVLSFSGNEVKDEDLAALLGLVDRELLLAASQSVLEGNSLTLLDLVEKLSDYGADYRNFARELLLHYREILLTKLAPDSSSLLAGVVPEERARLRPLAEAYSEEDLLRILDLLTKLETELRGAQDPRVTLELALLKMVQLLRLLPFAELVDRVERLAAGTGAPPRAPGPVLGSGSSLLAPASRTVTVVATSVVSQATVAPALSAAPAAPPAVATAGADDLLGALLAACQSRPSLAQPLRLAKARLDADVLVLEVSPDFVAFAGMHLDEYRDLAKIATGRSLKVQVASAVGVREAAAAPTPEAVKKERLRQEAAREPAVQEALDLFDGKLLDVRETKPSS
jgi:DNA polymerase-3 subunit gamma/tau